MKKGFTLIELLVVVLIIGILAAVALPQYQKVVEKSKAAQAFAMIRTVAAAQEAYHMANGTYATTFEELSVDIPWTGTTKFLASGHQSSSARPAKSNGDWSIQFYYEASGEGIIVGRISGPYAGAGFLYLLKSGYYPIHQLLCIEENSFSKPAGSYCQKIFKTAAPSHSPVS